MSKQTLKRGGRLFDDNPRGRPQLRGLGYGTPTRARRSIKRLRSLPRAYQFQAATTMYYRARYHANQTPEMREAMRLYESFLQELRGRGDGSSSRTHRHSRRVTRKLRGSRT
jgi:hypothetical protein